ncbi:epoxide hydrolase family protein [Microbacterium gorillae]|uniref:epoxide hydrolase family protein n=1 Tax=Microbacterium gorillae TaxID=1231063 RepID=UPI00069465A7|nr:epoxide hydrolase family protein [Microbacterium gorillae]
MNTSTTPALTPTSLRLEPYRVEIAQSTLDDLHHRLAATRWADSLPDDILEELPAFGPVRPGWQYGVPTSFVRYATDRWLADFDWRAAEARLNVHPQYLTEIDGQRIHFLHVRSSHPDATPLILTHGWPSSVFEFLDLVEPLTEPQLHGGRPEDAFHVVIPSVPGFTFSGPTTEPGWDRYRVARAWATLMAGLGYSRYGVHGNDLGAQVAPEVGRFDADHVLGVHVTQLFSFPNGTPGELDGLTTAEREQVSFLQAFNDEMSAFAALQATAPQNIAHALADSPAGQLAWTAQLLAGTDVDVTILNAAAYWLTNTAASAGRFYYEDRHAVEAPTAPTSTPTALSSFAWDFRPIRRFAQRDHANIVQWREHDRGGHWSAHEAPDLLVADLRDFFCGERRERALDSFPWGG